MSSLVIMNLDNYNGTDNGLDTDTENDIHYLKKKHPHDRDKYIEFDEPSHTYTIKGNADYTSVTTLVHQNFEPLDADKIIENMIKGKNWKNSKYYGKTPMEIKMEWEHNRDRAAREGTQLHYLIECYYNDMSVGSDSDEFGYFMNFTRNFEHLDKQAYRTEWTIYDEELKLAGSIDMIFKNPDDNTYMIYDWKRCKSIDKTSSWNKWSNNDIISHIPDTNYWHYALQLNIYKALLEKNYGIQVSKLYLVCLHPENKRKNYELIKIPELNKEIKDLFDDRIKTIKKIKND